MTRDVSLVYTKTFLTTMYFRTLESQRIGANIPIPTKIREECENIKDIDRLSVSRAVPRFG